MLYRDSANNWLQRCPGELPGETKHWTKIAKARDELQRCPGELPGETTITVDGITDPQELQRCPGELPGETRWRRAPKAGFEYQLQRCPGELPGETRREAPMPNHRPTGFNDAPANCRGRRRSIERRMHSRLRLQRCPGELPGETAGERLRPRLGTARFNDAPANCRGRRDGPGTRLDGVFVASTMPRRIAGGDSMAPTHCLPKRDSTNCERCRNIAWPTARATGSGLQIVKEHDAPQ